MLELVDMVLCLDKADVLSIDWETWLLFGGSGPKGKAS